MKFKQKIRDFFTIVFPSTKTELLLFFIFFVAYGILGSHIALNYRIIYDERIPWDAYFSFDNRSIINTGGGFERHPLSNYFFDQIRCLALLISENKRNSDFRITLALFSNLAVSLSLIQIFKYLQNIIRLPNTASFLILFFFSFFSTNITLSFTPETYTYTLFLLSLYHYYAALKIRKGEKIPATALTFAGISVGGLTITNIVKVYIPILFEHKIFWNWKKIGNAILRVFISTACFMLLYLYRLDFDYHRIFSKTGEQYEKFSKPKATPLWDMVYSWFFGGNLLFSNFIIRDYHNQAGFKYKALFMDVYSSVAPYIFISLLLILVFWSYVKNFKNSLVQILMLSFFVDIIIHCVLKFGLHTSYIYGGHFVFVYPLMLGWLFYSYKNSPKILTFLMALLSILFVYLVTNNLYRLEEFFYFLNQYYQ